LIGLVVVLSVVGVLTQGGSSNVSPSASATASAPTATATASPVPTAAPAATDSPYWLKITDPSGASIFTNASSAQSVELMQGLGGTLTEHLRPAEHDSQDLHGHGLARP
jgi:hypothetical protein